MAPTDYSKWDNIDTDSETEASVSEKKAKPASAAAKPTGPPATEPSNSSTRPIDYSKWDNIDTDSEPDEAITSGKASPVPLASKPKDSQGGIDYSKWDSVDADSERGAIRIDEIAKQGLSPSGSKTSQAVKQGGLSTRPVDEWTKWESNNGNSGSGNLDDAVMTPPTHSLASTEASKNHNAGTNPKPETPDANLKATKTVAPENSSTKPSPKPGLSPMPGGQINILSSAPGPDGQRSILGVQKPALCGVCFNLDPNQAPLDSDPTHSWAVKEYNVPPETPSCKITIQKSSSLLESVKERCFYCSVVATVLGALHPGWDKEESFIHIYVAQGLPVVVRLQFGRLAINSIGSEALSELGLVLPDGEKMNFSIKMAVRGKALEAEIYRPHLSRDEMSRGDLNLLPLIEYIGIANEVPQHAGEGRCYEFIRDSILECREKHKCERNGPLPLLPDRIIWIQANNATQIQLVELKKVHAQYIALSYCWGPVNKDTFLTNTSSFNERRAGIQYNDLPPLFQDVVHCARVLGIDYIWIDRLCIIQGDDKDFKRQAPKMGEIYGNATLTIAAASATSENDRILTARDDKWIPGAADTVVKGVGKLSLRFRRRTHPLETETSGGDYGKVSTRAWIWQERLLSTRTIFFTPSALKFECRCHSVWEGFGQGVTGRSWSSRLDNISHRSWLEFVEEFMRRDITHPSDRLPAMESVMKRIQKLRGWSPLWGLWQDALVPSLCWNSSEPSSYSGKHWWRMNPAYYAPSWSWASIDGPISYVSIKALDFIGNHATDPMKYDLQVCRIDPVRGAITAGARYVTVTINCRIFNFGKKPNPTEKDLRYEYGLLNVSSSGEPFPIHPDVALEPWTEALGDGTLIPAPVRVSRSKSPPTSSWSAECICLLVGVQKLRCLVLILGPSLRENGCWERVGMASGLEPAVFANSLVKLWTIV